MKLGKYPINRTDSKRVKALKRKLKQVESSIACCVTLMTIDLSMLVHTIYSKLKGT